MTPRAPRCCAFVGLLLGLAAPSAWAQTGTQRWNLSSTLRETITNNLSLAAPGGSGGRTNASTAATVGLSFSRSRAGSSLGAGGWASGGLFGQGGQYSSVRYGLGASSDLALTPRARTRFAASYSDGLNLEELYATRLGLPQLDVKSFTGATGLTYKLSPSTSAAFTFDTLFIRYRTDARFDSAQLAGDSLAPADVVPPLDDEPPVAPMPPGLDTTGEVLGVLAGAGLQASRLDFWSLRAGASLAHQFSPRTGMAGGFGYRRTYEQSGVGAPGDHVEAQLGMSRVLDDTASLSLGYGGQYSRYPSRFSSHSLAVQASKAAGRRLRLDGSLGGSYLQGPDRESSGWQLIGGAGLSLRLKRMTLASRYERNRYQSLVVARSYSTDSIFASFGYRFSRKFSVSAYGHGRRASDAQAQVGSYQTFLVGSSLGVRIKKRTSAGTSYTYQRFERRPDPAVARFVISVFVGSGLSWR